MVDSLKMKVSLIVGALCIVLGTLLLLQLSSGSLFGHCIDSQCPPIECLRVSGSNDCTLAVTTDNFSKYTTVYMQSFFLFGLGLGIIVHGVFSRYMVMKKK